MNKILEAIQKGIQMGLEIQDDILDSSIFQGSWITSDYYAERSTEMTYVRKNYVDLGLPSGTLWCKYDIGSIYEKVINEGCVDANGQLPGYYAWYGWHYVWGATKPYNKQRNVFNSLFPPKELSLENDAAYVRYHDKCKGIHIPSREQIDELIEHTTQTLTKDYMGVNMLNGITLTSQINGEEIFFPFSGESTSDTVTYVRTGSLGKIWSRSIGHYSSDVACCLSLSNGSYGAQGAWSRTASIDKGFCIRPVIG